MRNITREAIEVIDEPVVTKKEQNENGKFNQKNYLNVKLKPGEKSKELTIRLLPIDKDSNTPFKKIKMHTLKVDKKIAAGGWKSYVCLNKTEDIDHETLGHKCPFCELNYEAYKKSTEVTDPKEKKRWQDISFDNLAQDVVVVRCIERGAEEDGPKFWKFNLHKKKDDPYNLMLNIYRARKKEDEDEGIENPINIFDIYEGKDLIVTITAETDENGKPNGKTSVAITDKSRITPLSRSEEQMEEWINDPKKWSDVFVAKPYEYLSIILDGKMPYFDKANGVWVEKDFADKNETESEETKNAEAQIDEEAKAAERAILNRREENKLPFED